MTNQQFPTLLKPELCDPPHKITHPEKFEYLVEKFTNEGWDYNHPYLIGYNYLGKIQLLTGSHRWAAAMEAEIEIPVVIESKEKVYSCFGDLEKWNELMVCSRSSFQINIEKI